MIRKKTTWIYLILFGCFWLNCSITGGKLPEPEGRDRLVVVGSIIIDLFEYRGITTTYRSDVKVLIAGRHREGGKIVHQNYWVKTDYRGYFILPNVPPGDYALRGFRFQTAGAGFFLTAVNPLRSESDKFIIGRAVKIPEAAFVFNFPRTDHYVNLRHNYFIIDRGQAVQHKVYIRLDNLRLITGKTVQEPDVVSYFTRKFPNSSWFKK